MRKDPTRPDLLDRFDKLGISGAQFEKLHSLPRNMIAMMRQGAYGGERAAVTVQKLADAIAATTGAAKDLRKPQKKGAPPGVVPIDRALVAAALTAAPSAPAPSEKRPPGRPRESASGSIQDDLRARIRGARTIKKKEALLRYVMELAAEGLVSDQFARLVNESVGQQRQLEKVQAEEEEKARAGEPITIKIEYVNSWRQATGGGSGEDGGAEDA